MEDRKLIRRQIGQCLREISDEIDQNYLYMHTSNDDLTLSFFSFSVIIIFILFL
jgi:hypothetical protein